MCTIFMILFEFYVCDSECKDCNISQFCVKQIVCESFHTPQKFADHGIPSLFMVRYSSLHFQLDELISISIFSDRFESRSVPFNLENTYKASKVQKGRIQYTVTMGSSLLEVAFNGFFDKFILTSMVQVQQQKA